MVDSYRISKNIGIEYLLNTITLGPMYSRNSFLPQCLMTPGEEYFLGEDLRASGFLLVWAARCSTHIIVFILVWVNMRKFQSDISAWVPLVKQINGQAALRKIRCYAITGLIPDNWYHITRHIYVNLSVSSSVYTLGRICKIYDTVYCQQSTISAEIYPVLWTSLITYRPPALVRLL